MPTKNLTIDAYINKFPKDVQEILIKFKELIKSEAPKATEKISYGIPTFHLHENLVHFAAYKSHIGFYPTPGALEHFKKEIAPFKNAKGSVQFPLDQEIPWELIRKIVKWRVKRAAKN